MHELLRLLRRARPYRLPLVAGFASGVLAAAFEPLMASIAKLVMGELERVPQLVAEGRLWRTVLLFAAGVMALALVRAMLSYASLYLVASCGQRVLANLRADLYRNLVERPVGFLARHHSSEFVSRVTSDVQRIDVGLSLRLSDLIVNLPAVLLLAGYLWFLDWRLAFVVTVLLPVVGLLVRRWARRVKAASRKSQEHTATLATVLQETLSGVRIVKAFLGENREVARFAAVNDTLRRTNMRAYRTLALSSPVLDVLGAATFALLIGVAAFEIARGDLAVDSFVAFVVCMISLYRAMKKVTNAFTELQNTSAAARRCFDVLDDESLEPGGRRTVDGLERGIELRDVSFSYGGADVLSDFSLTLRKGEVVALVGESGAGKTTVASLLLRFFDATAGTVSWDGVDLREIGPRSLRAQIALVTQDVVVFDDTVARNIAYGEAEPDMARVEEAARAARADDFIRDLEEGYQTRLGQGGNRLSGGQKQRIAIARAIYKDAPVLVLDEATSSLDATSEVLVQEALARLMHDRTVLVVAHRLATVRSADRIVVMSEGRIVEEGSHEALLGQHGTYRKLHELQSR